MKISEMLKGIFEAIPYVLLGYLIGIGAKLTFYLVIIYVLYLCLCTGIVVGMEILEIQKKGD